MAQSTLRITYDDLKREVGRFMGWGRDPSAWADTNNATDYADVQRAGLAMVYWPFDESGLSISHAWTFLNLPHQLLTAESQEKYDLPDDFGDLVGSINFEDNNGEICVTNQSLVDQLKRTVSTASGRPSHVYFEPQKMNAVTGLEQQRMKLVCWPTPDGEYTLNFRYSVLPDALVDNTREHPYGGAKYGELFVSAFLAQADLKLNDKAPSTSEYYQEFKRQLAAAIVRDGRNTQGIKLGYNGDNSDFMSDRRSRYPYRGNYLVELDDA